MNDAKLTIKAINDIIQAAAVDLPMTDRCALRAGLQTFISDIETHYEDKFGGVDGYLAEKLLKLRWHVNANLGFDTTNGHGQDQHRSWAYGALHIVEGLLQAKFPDLF